MFVISRDISELGLIDHNDDAFNFAALCRGEEMRGEIIHKLKCYHDTRNDPWFSLQPVKVEQVHIAPDIFLFHDIITKAELDDIKKTAGPLVSKDSSSYKWFCSIWLFSWPGPR